MLYSVLSFSLLSCLTVGDVYLHLPRGSNNRLNEAAANRNNANRLFDSQNNNRGGYNVGEMGTEDGFAEETYIATFDDMYNFDFLYENGQKEQQYEMLYFEESTISATWTNQHGAGNAKTTSQIILQFICDTFPRADSAANGDYGFGPSGTISSSFSTTALQNQAAMLRRHGLRVELYNGGNTNTPTEPNSIANGAATTIQATYTGNHDNSNGRRESEEYYSLCKSRSRNYGLFHADQDLKGTSQIYTRQNPDGTRRGLECPEERDYFPWWNPSPFHDIAIITPDVEYCESDIAPNSQNVALKYQCVNGDGTSSVSSPSSWLPTTTYVAYNLNQTACTAAGGTWEGFSWGADEPECVDSYWSKANYLGNVDNTKRGGKMAHYDWTLPTFDDLVNKHQCYEYSETVTKKDGTSTTTLSCVRMEFRIRYNQSTMDYDPYKTNSSMDYDDNDGIISPIEQNPTVDVGAYAQGLKLAINTAQTGRTFQDNSHTFLVCERPSSASWEAKQVYNVNVRGKRGNIVQTFPAIEYDFEPQHISISTGTCLHFQWEGSNTHNNGNPGGDGQTGDAGEGRGGSDRSNLVQARSMLENYPTTYDKDVVTEFFDKATCYHPLDTTTVSSKDAQYILGSAGFYRGYSYAAQQFASHGDDALLDELLNNVSAAFRQGLICCINSNAIDQNDADLEFAFLSTRNNNFSNRDQKLKIVISNNPEDPSLW